MNDPALIAHLGLGSNLGDRWAFVTSAFERILALDGEAIISSIYESVPVGGPSDQGPYLSAVVRCELELGPTEVLALAGELERAAGRVRTERWGPRTLDVDVLTLEVRRGDLLEALSIVTPLLTIPHPRLEERAFVLAPLEECAPHLVPRAWRDRLGGAQAVHDAVRVVGHIVRDVAP